MRKSARPRAVIAAAMLAALLGEVLSAAELEMPNLPRPRPENSVVATDTVTATEAIEAFVPIPRPLPTPHPALAMIAPDTVEETRPTRTTPVEPRDPACLARLRALGVVFSEEEPIDPYGACHVDHPLKVTSIGSGIAVTADAIMTCDAAEALALWAKDVLLPTAKEHLAALPSEIAQASTYVCRSRNNQVGAKLSEHAHANAVDVAAVGFSGREPIAIGAGTTDEAAKKFERAIRAGACDYFTTVLGPGSDAAHANHLHFDLAERRGGHRLCELDEPETVAAP
jgi:hypothetical protein